MPERRDAAAAPTGGSGDADAPTVLPVEVAGERVLLDPARALVWPAGRLALIADPHFGKDDVFRRAGVAVPAGVVGADLARLESVVRVHEVARLVVLGDFFHARPRAGDGFDAGLDAFLARHPALRIDVVAGNHDRAGAGARADRLAWHDDPLLEPPFAFRHEPVPLAGAYALAGHVHPVAVLRGAGGDRARLPAFWVRADHAVLPAFGAFTGGAPVRPAAGDRLYVVAGSRVLALPAA